MTQANVQVKIDGVADGARSLAQWLRSEDALRGRVRLANCATQPSDMGGILDAVTIAIGSGGAATVFVQSLFAWLGQRKNNMSVRLQLISPNGQEMTLHLTSVHEPDAVIDKVLEYVRITTQN